MLTIIRVCIYIYNMIVCICNAVSDRQIKEAVNQGAASMADLRVATGCGTTCGKCTTMAVQIIDQHSDGMAGLGVDSGFSLA